MVSDGFGFRAKSEGNQSDHSITDESIQDDSMEYKHAHYFLRAALSAKDIDHTTFG